MSAKLVTIPPSSPICNLAEVKLLNRDPVKEMTGKTTAGQHQHTVSSGTSNLDIDLKGTVLSEDQKEQAHSFLSKWPHIFSKGPTNLGRFRKNKSCRT